MVEHLTEVHIRLGETTFAHNTEGMGEEKERPDQQHPQDQHDGCPAGVASRTQLGIQAGDTEAA